MKKTIVSSISISAVSLQLPLIIACNTEKNQIMYERLMIINGVRTLLGFIDENDLPKLQPFFDDNYKLITKNIGTTNFHEEAFLNKTFLNDQKHAKDQLSLRFLTTFLKLTPNKENRFDLSNILLKLDKITYFKIDTKILPNSDSDKKSIIFTNWLANFVFENKTTSAQIENFNVPIKDAQIDIFNEMFNDKFESQNIKDENYNNFFNIDRDFFISGFEIGNTLADVKIKPSQSALLVEKLANILKNFNLKLDDLIKFNIKLNREKSNIDLNDTDENLKAKPFKDGDFIDIEFTLKIPNGDIGQSTDLTTDFSLTLTKGPL